MKCASCGADLTPNQKFCGTCGKRVEIQNVDASKIRKCSKCPSYVRLTELYCTDCGAPVEEEKKITCQGKKTDGAICNAELSDSAMFCPECGTKRAETNDTLDDGKEDKNKETDIHVVTENPVIEEVNKIQEPTVFYEPNSKIPEEPSVIQVKEQNRGLAVICTHSNFLHKGHNLGKRPGADDLYMMKTCWELYGCQVISYPDKKSEFYNEQLIGKIEAELENLPDVEMFVFVLSSHGEEREEKDLHEENKKYEHYFFTKDGNCSTQDLMNKIAKIQKLDNKLKIFIIQACKSRASGENEDQGYEIETTGKQVQSQDGKDRADAKGIPSEEDIPPQDGIDKPDAKGYMPPPEEDEIIIVQLPSEGISHACSSRPVPQPSQPEITPDLERGEADELTAPTSEEDDTKNDEKDYTIQTVPHCDDCIVMFASMSGKYAYSKFYSPLSGGWLIEAIDNVLKLHEKEEKVHILDMLTEVNGKVAKKEARRKNLKIIPELIVSEKGNKEELQKQFRTHMDSLNSDIENNLARVEIRECKEEFNSLYEHINQADTEDGLLKLKDKVLTLTQKIATELSSVTLKAQSNFFHNLAFDEEELYLYKNKSENIMPVCNVIPAEKSP